MATTIVSRATKGAPLTVAEHDANHQNSANTADSAMTLATNAAPGGRLVLFTGTARSLLASDNGNVVRCSNAAAITITVPAGLPSGFSCVLVQGAAGLVTVVAGSGATVTPAPALVTNGIESDVVISPAGTNAYTAYSPPAPSSGGGGGAETLAELDDIVTFNLAAVNTSVAAIKTNADAALVQAYSAYSWITGTRGEGSILIVHVPTGWLGEYQWQVETSPGTWADISGATGDTFTDGGTNLSKALRCVTTPAYYVTNVIGGSGGGVGLPFTPFTELWQTGGHGSVVPTPPWTYIVGSPIQYVITGVNNMGYYDSNGAPSAIIRNAGGSNGTIEFPRSVFVDSDQGFWASGFPYFIFRSDSTRTQFSYVLVNTTTQKIVYTEFDGTGPTNESIGPSTLAGGSYHYGLKIILNGAMITIQLDSGSGYVTELLITAVQGLTFPYVGVGHSVIASGASMGRMIVTAS